ncbi:dihydropteroate synthase [Candidatus Acetothermia bacterium]|nr:MAG: dihydropteroate synthase [Candidatus Acetothermia bacterium]HHK67139.1 dihydropteroate synthase [Candidatus Acetothermia bacterium]
MDRFAEWERKRDRVLVMGVLNVTPDSFYDGGIYAQPTAAVKRGLQMETDGADIIDIGGESSRPGAESIPLQEELDRVIPVIEGIRKRSDALISVDTTKAEVAAEALSAGATMVNDISALRFDPQMPMVVAKSGAALVLMHMLGTPATMQHSPAYGDVVEEIRSFLAERISYAVKAGVAQERIVLDPGIGFGKLLSHNIAIIRRLNRLTDLGAPILIGVSRKSFIGEILGLPPEERLEGTIAASAIAIMNGADIIRVHDAKEGRRAADVAFRLREDGR